MPAHDRLPDSIIEGIPAEVFYPIKPFRDALKIVYSNHPAILRGLSYKVFPPGTNVVWFPECEMNGSQIDSLARGHSLQGASIIVTNSVLLLRAFQMHRRNHPKTIIFYYVQYNENRMGMCPGDFIVHGTNDLDSQACPQVGWEKMQAEDIQHLKADEQTTM